MRTGRIYSLFDVYGLELEYMIVDRDTLKIRPIVDELIKKKIGEISSDVENGEICWSNELTAHVVELKTTMPTADISRLSESFSANIREINALLKDMNAMLLPTAAHPFMDPLKETVLWQHEYNEVYALYNRIFDCRGHGWSNLQSFHINLPFQNDQEFQQLHAAIRVLLPVIPALSASSPILDGKVTGSIDSRMEAYLNHQEELPSLMGKLIPEQVFSEVEYNTKIYAPILRDIEPFDEEKIMEHHFLNSRGAIARFDRGAIEIRVIDVQECPLADMAICSLISAVLKNLVNEQWCTIEEQMSWHEDPLRSIFEDVIHEGSNAQIKNKDFLRLFGLSEASISARKLWSALYQIVKSNIPESYQKALEHILDKGNLSERIISQLGSNPRSESISMIYLELSKCLEENRLYLEVQS